MSDSEVFGYGGLYRPIDSAVAGADVVPCYICRARRRRALHQQPSHCESCKAWLVNCRKRAEDT